MAPSDTKPHRLACTHTNTHRGYIHLLEKRLVQAQLQRKMQVHVQTLEQVQVHVQLLALVL